MRSALRFLVCGSSFLLGACLASSDDHNLGSSHSDSGPLPDGANSYKYVGLDANGSPIVTGLLTLFFADETEGQSISGSWVLSGPDDPDLGPQIGEGALTGSVHEGNIAIDLNPGYADLNVYLFGEFDDGAATAFRGTWNFSTIVGAVNRGSFSATRE